MVFALILPSFNVFEKMTF